MMGKPLSKSLPIAHYVLFCYGSGAFRLFPNCTCRKILFLNVYQKCLYDGHNEKRRKPNFALKLLLNTVRNHSALFSRIRPSSPPKTSFDPLSRTTKNLPVRVECLWFTWRWTTVNKKIACKDHPTRCGKICTGGGMSS